MAIIPNAQKFHTLSSSTVTSDLGSARANSGREVYTMQDIINTVDGSISRVTGTGTTNSLVMWTNGPNGVIGDANIQINSTDIAITSSGNNIAIGSTAVSASPGSNSVLIGSSITTNGSDQQINIGYNNTSTGTSNLIIGSSNTQTGNGSYSVLIGSLNTSVGNTSGALGRSNSLTASNTYTLGQSNSSSFTGGVSTAGLMNVSIGYDNSLDIDKGAVFGFANDITGSFGWTLGSGKEAVVIGSRLTMSLLGPNRSSADRSGPRVIIATGSGLASGVEEKRNSVEYYTPETSRSGVFHPALYNSASYADDTAAAAGGVRLGELYRNGSIIQIRMT